jgi:dTDP-4-amino-4,6-dideoxygalactose transaminase
MIPFNKPYMTGRELGYIERAHAGSQLSGDGEFTRLCNRWLEQRTGTPRALLTHSCTAALEMAAFLLDAGAGDEIIMPSFTFVSTANAFVIRGATPVFVDIRPDTLNLDETLVEARSRRARAPLRSCTMPVSARRWMRCCRSPSDTRSRW